MKNLQKIPTIKLSYVQKLPPLKHGLVQPQLSTQSLSYASIKTKGYKVLYSYVEPTNALIVSWCRRPARCVLQHRLCQGIVVVELPPAGEITLSSSYQTARGDASQCVVDIYAGVAILSAGEQSLLSQALGEIHIFFYQNSSRQEELSVVAEEILYTPWCCSLFAAIK